RARAGLQPREGRVMSIRHRLIVWLLSSVLAGGLLAAGVVFFQARDEANELFDYQLRQLALTLRDRIYMPTQLAEVLQGEEALDFVIQVWARDGTRLHVAPAAACAERRAAGLQRGADRPGALARLRDPAARPHHPGRAAALRARAPRPRRRLAHADPV